MTRSAILILIVIIPSTVLAYSSSITVKQLMDAWRTKATSEHPECMTISGANQEEVDLYWFKYRGTDTRTFKCYLACILQRFQLVFEDGSLNEDAIVHIDKVTNDMIKDCHRNYVHPDLCQLSFDFATCIMKDLQN
ncbi:uncharacterized protein LOC116181207 [Photinus pyralis]|uniref:uncharacterized protein LOC116181182 n=1 Tax=Photinus pyralis TaxID=7054 RepID=UPI00126708EF|nr:uncharacterized protein LOC116181182 [Photinus pyralis]XP_031357364.1 uncharacterized protein LOC116181207 [Photinus pyralis]